MKIVASKEQEVHGRMTHPEWGVLPCAGFTMDLDADFLQVWFHKGRQIMVALVLTPANYNDPIAAHIYHDHAKANVAWNSKGLSDVLRYQLDPEVETSGA